MQRRTALQAGAIGLIGLGVNQVTALRSPVAATENAPINEGGHLHLPFRRLLLPDSFDPKPAAYHDGIRGEFKPSTRTPGLGFCEHLPRLAEYSERWALCCS